MSALWWAFALGADLGGNTTAVAAAANVVVIGIVARHRQPISFWEFTKYGVLVTRHLADRVALRLGQVLRLQLKVRKPRL